MVAEQFRAASIQNSLSVISGAEKADVHRLVCNIEKTSCNSAYIRDKSKNISSALVLSGITTYLTEITLLVSASEFDARDVLVAFLF